LASEKFIFTDTNLFEHFPPVSQIDWPGLACCGRVVLIVPPVTISELNKHKDTSTRSKLKRRATEALLELSRYSKLESPIEVRPNVEIQFRSREPLIDFGEFQLSPVVNDDRLLASAIEFAIEEGLDKAEVLVTTADLGLTLKVNGQTLIGGLPLPETLRLPDDLDDDSKKIKLLEDELRKLRNALPALCLSFGSKKPFATFRVPEPACIDEQRFKELLQKERAEHPPILLTPTSNLLESVLRSITDEHVSGYNRDLEKYFVRREQWYRKIFDRGNWNLLTYKLQLVLHNEGGAPGEDVDIGLHFPDGFEVLQESELPPTPQEPKLPLKPAERMFPQPQLQIPRLYGSDLPSFQTPSVPRTRIAGIRKTNSYEVDLRVDRIKHTKSEILPSLFLHFFSIDEAHSFNFDYRIVAANCPNVFEGKLNVIVER
jgi:hypothetical protein